jgi:hypothetical protein
MLVDPIDCPDLAPTVCLNPLRSHELHSAGTVFADVGDECECTSSGDLEFPSPAIEHELVIRQEPPKECLNSGVPVLDCSQRHRY